MSASGAKVLMLRSVELARNHGVRVHSRSTFSNEEGTWILPAEDVMEKPIISGVTHSETEVIFTLTGIPDRPGAAAAVFDAVAAENVNVDTIIQNVVHGVAELSFSVPHEDVRRDAARDRARRAVARPDARSRRTPRSARSRSSEPACARTRASRRKMFRTLADHEINLRMISTSPIKLSCVIARTQIPEAVRAVHAAFELERAPEEEA